MPKKGGESSFRPNVKKPTSWAKRGFRPLGDVSLMVMYWTISITVGETGFYLGKNSSVVACGNWRSVKLMSPLSVASAGRIRGRCPLL